MSEQLEKKEIEFNILYYGRVYKRWWKKIVCVIGISIVITMFACRFVPTTYVSNITLLLIGGGGSAQGGGGTIGRILGLSSLGGSSSGNEIVAILKSRRMSRDIAKEFKLKDKKNFSWSMESSQITAGLKVTVKGSDPELIQKIANFAIVNLDKINEELELSPNRRMAKVLDPATYGASQARNISQKIFAAGLLAFLLSSLYAFFSEYVRDLKEKERHRGTEAQRHKVL